MKPIVKPMETTRRFRVGDTAVPHMERDPGRPCEIRKPPCQPKGGFSSTACGWVEPLETISKTWEKQLGSSEHLGEHTKIPWSIIKYDRYPHSVAIIGSIILPHSKTDPLQNQWQSVLQQLVRTQQPAWPRSLAPGIFSKKNAEK